jgi:hypothetical protein
VGDTGPKASKGIINKVDPNGIFPANADVYSYSPINMNILIVDWILNQLNHFFPAL